MGKINQSEHFKSLPARQPVPRIESININAIPMPPVGRKNLATRNQLTTQQHGRQGLSFRDWYWLAFVALVTVTSCVPFFRTMFVGLDEAVLLNGAERLLRGSRIYADFFEFLPPGGFVLTAAWFSLTGISVGSGRSLAILTVVGIACFTYLACRQASKNAPISACLAIGWVVMSQGWWTQVSHHLIATLFSMVTAWATLTNSERPRRRWPLIAGMAAGMAAMTTTHRGAIVMLAALPAFLFGVRRSPVQLFAYILGCALVPTALLAYLITQHSIVAAFDDVIVFAVEHYSAIQSVPFGFSGWQTPLTYVFPLAALLMLLAFSSEGNRLTDRVFWQSITFGLAGFLGCFPRPDIVHIAFAVPLVCPLLAYSGDRLGQRWRLSWWRYRFFVVLLGGVLIGFCALPAVFLIQLSSEVLRSDLVSSPRGNIANFGTLAEGGAELVARIEATPQNESFFFYPAIAKLGFLTAREQVSKYEVLMPGYTTPLQYNDACLSVMQGASWVVINRRQTDPHLLKQNFPAMLDPAPRETKRFEQALERGFELSAQYGLFELRRRRNSANETMCADILE
jgi:hypothetical protein